MLDEKLIAIEHIEIDPKIRKYKEDLLKLNKDQLICTLLLKGYSVSKYQTPVIRLLKAIEDIENGIKPEDVIVPMTVGRYKMVKKLILIKENGLLINTTIPEKDIEEAYDYLLAGENIPEQNLCHPEAFKKERSLKPLATEQEMKIFENSGFSSEEELQRQTAIYNEFVVKRIPKAVIQKKYGVSLSELNNAINRVRKFVTNRFVPQEELCDALEESKQTIANLVELRHNAQKFLKEFDERHEDTYKNFIQVCEDKYLGDKIIISAIAKERHTLMDTILKTNKALAEERKSELELKGLINQPVNLLQLNLYNSMENPDKKLLDAALNTSAGVRNEKGDVIDINAKVIDENKYVMMLTEEDQARYSEIMEKLAELKINDFNREDKDE